jgi:hypothetical protein
MFDDINPELHKLFEKYRKHLGVMHAEGAAILTLAHVILAVVKKPKEKKT